jgi:DAK2 domain
MRVWICRKQSRQRGKGTFFIEPELETNCRAADTAMMTARLGRASYVGAELLPPDPGAVGIAALVEGIANAIQQKTK